ncbi:MAG: hypothetical protein GTO16_02300 [Candidatus Aminicenantes bacterium]|nr:hypothetical protein [Candidatus Aminicenantes bacterium]
MSTGEILPVRSRERGNKALSHGRRERYESRGSRKVLKGTGVKFLDLLTVAKLKVYYWSFRIWLMRRSFVA